MTSAGLEPAIPGSVCRCLIHWATRPVHACRTAVTGVESHRRARTGAGTCPSCARSTACVPRHAWWRCARMAAGREGTRWPGTCTPPTVLVVRTCRHARTHHHAVVQARRLTSAGLEPAIPGSVGRCLIHWATGPVDPCLGESSIALPPVHAASTYRDMGGRQQQVRRAESASRYSSTGTTDMWGQPS